jgi:hypothetical protein
MGLGAEAPAGATDSEGAPAVPRDRRGEHRLEQARAGRAQSGLHLRRRHHAAARLRDVLRRFGRGRVGLLHGVEPAITSLLRR